MATHPCDVCIFHTRHHLAIKFVPDMKKTWIIHSCDVLFQDESRPAPKIIKRLIHVHFNLQGLLLINESFTFPQR